MNDQFADQSAQDLAHGNGSNSAILSGKRQEAGCQQERGKLLGKLPRGSQIAETCEGFQELFLQTSCPASQGFFYLGWPESGRARC